MTRRDFVKATTASLAAASATPDRATAAPARSADILVQRTVRPVVISDYIEGVRTPSLVARA